MGVDAIKKVIHDKVDRINNLYLLEEILGILDSEQEMMVNEVDPTKYIDRLFAENDNLLKRLS